MATFRQFEDIDAWCKARRLTADIYAASAQGLFAPDFDLRDQMRRAAVSVMSNIAEGFERSGNGEFLQFLAMAKGSAGEVRAQLFVALDQGHVSKEDFERLAKMATEVSRLVSGLMSYLRTSNVKGTRFRRDPQLEVRNLKPET